jgi:hypothetical protein
MKLNTAGSFQHHLNELVPQDWQFSNVTQRVSIFVLLLECGDFLMFGFRSKIIQRMLFV